ncbi:MAG: hypothetical protein O2780_08720 [Proteobacteria bacterium]|nr:hypothetical protein [Pseudomonadota bacterium]
MARRKLDRLADSRYNNSPGGLADKLKVRARWARDINRYCG